MGVAQKYELSISFREFAGKDSADVFQGELQFFHKK